MEGHGAFLGGEVRVAGVETTSPDSAGPAARAVTSRAGGGCSQRVEESPPLGGASVPMTFKPLEGDGAEMGLVATFMPTACSFPGIQSDGPT